MCMILEIDWNAVGSVVGGIGDLTAGLATIALAIFGYKGLSAWRVQLTDTRKLEAGQNLLINSYEADEVLKYIIAPFVTAGELNKVARREGESEENYHLRQNYEAIHNRYLEHVEIFNKLRASCFAAKATLGDDAYTAATELLKLPQHILNSASSLNFNA